VMDEMVNSYRHLVGNLFDLLCRYAVSNLQFKPYLARESLTAGFQHRDDSRLVGGEESATDVKRGRAQDFSLFSHCQLGGATADVHVKDSTFPLSGKVDRAGAVGREQRFEIVACASANKVSSLRREKIGDGARVVPADCLARENDGARVDMIRADSRLLVGGIDESPEGLVVDSFAAGSVRREMDGR